jgi:TatA/E family protein of Tat protein translocase
MDFLGTGWGEILLILIVALLLWGPGKIIEVSRSIGKMIYAFKKAAGDITTQVSRELEEQKRENSQVSRNKD